MKEVTKINYSKRKFSITLPEISIYFRNINIDIGSTFSLIPDWGGDKIGIEKFYFDWLYFHLIIN
jgi:hypothetical protein